MHINLEIDEHIIENLSEEEIYALKYLRQKKKDCEKKMEYYRNTDRIFSIYISDIFSYTSLNYTLSYIINPEISFEDTDQCTCFREPDAVKKAFLQAASDFDNYSKKVLLYLGKFPGYGFDVDGGSLTAAQIINTLKKRCQLSVVFIRKNDEIFNDSDVNSVKYVQYKDPWNNKFIRRLENLDSNREALSDHSNFDIIIAAHISKLFGLDTYGEDFWSKTILFPMFCSQSYIRAGEIVPEEYINNEQEVINRINKVITPSYEECKDLINDFGCIENKITVIPRGLSKHITYRHRTSINNPLKIVCIGTVKKQKNTKDTLKLMKILESYGLSCELHLICTIQDQASHDAYNELCKLILENNMTKKVCIHVSISQIEIAELLDEMDINVSMSSWETFGRGIFEGAAAGIPTFVFEHLKTVKRLSNNNRGFYFASDIEDMAKTIYKSVLNQNEVFSDMSKALSVIYKDFSYLNEQKQLVSTILNSNITEKK